MTALIQPEIIAVGREIFDRMSGRQAGLFDRHSLAGRLIRWSMENPNVKTQLFRLVDVLPALAAPKEIAGHAADYLSGPEAGLSSAARWGVKRARFLPWLTAFAARQAVLQMAKTFILAADEEEALAKLESRRRQGLAFTLDILGETVLSEAEADRYQDRYLRLLETVARAASAWPEDRLLDRDARGPIPRVNLSIKISALDPQIHPAAPEPALDRLSHRLRPILRRARELGVFVNFDMEHTALKDLTLDLFRRLGDEAEFREFPHLGLAFQTYLLESASDLEKLIAWTQQRPCPITLRLIKGAYWDTESILASQRNWPVPVFQDKAETDANFQRLARRLLENEEKIHCAFGTHSVRSIASCIVQARRAGVPQANLEFQMLYGMAEPIKSALVEMGYRVREYSPVGEVLSGMSYLVRRLLENTANQSFLRATFTREARPDELLRDPEEILAARKPGPGPGAAPARKGFHNAPLTDFTKRPNRAAMKAALDKTRAEFGRRYPLVIAGKEVWTNDEILSVNPSAPREIVGRVARARLEEADEAALNARLAFLDWKKKPVEQRAELLERAAGLLERDRFRFAALEVFETGKNWTESDADVVEAIDFCRYYAEQMRRLAGREHAIPGETSRHEWIPRGLALIIGPWNFPLAILCGMTTAALVTGNCVIVKPSEQSSVIAAWFCSLLQCAGAPPGVVNFLPGSGREIGAHLVRHPDIAVIAFTGSKEVGLDICEAAGRTPPGQNHLKKVVCEMGGKNAVLVDSDADFDEAIPGAVHSAFGYQGQKCSALSRLILLDEIHDRFLDRLIEATRSLRIGPPQDPDNVIGPLIDQAAYDRVRQYIEIGKEEARLAFQGTVPAGEGYFVPPTIFADVPPQARMAREEIFGPVLAVLKARDFEQALTLANDSSYALTGGIYSRNPRHLERVKTDWQAGNVYINRPITGAIVGRHPFGGFKLSGGGTKAGGPEYLQHFLVPRVVTENLIRRGFAPSSE